MTETTVTETTVTDTSTQTETAAIAAREAESSASVAEQAADAAIALARTEAARAEQNAAADVAEIERRLDSKWNDTNLALTMLQGQIAELSTRLTSLTPVAVAAEVKAEAAIQAVEATAEAVLATPLSDTPNQDEKETDQLEAESERRRGRKSLFPLLRM